MQLLITVATLVAILYTTFTVIICS